MFWRKKKRTIYSIVVVELFLCKGYDIGAYFTDEARAVAYIEWLNSINDDPTIEYSFHKGVL